MQPHAKKKKIMILTLGENGVMAKITIAAPIILRSKAFLSYLSQIYWPMIVPTNNPKYFY